VIKVYKCTMIVVSALE